jgi:hypothetical protein
MSTQRCKFCGCTPRRACQLIAVRTFDKSASDLEPYFLPPTGIALVPAGAETFLVPCAWLLDDVCTNPSCVEKAYAEARLRAILWEAAAA